MIQFRKNRCWREYEPPEVCSFSARQAREAGLTIRERRKCCSSHSRARLFGPLTTEELRKRIEAASQSFSLPYNLREIADAYLNIVQDYIHRTVARFIMQYADGRRVCSITRPARKRPGRFSYKAIAEYLKHLAEIRHGKALYTWTKAGKPGPPPEPWKPPDWEEVRRGIETLSMLGQAVLNKDFERVVALGRRCRGKYLARSGIRGGGSEPLLQRLCRDKLLAELGREIEPYLWKLSEHYKPPGWFDDPLAGLSCRFPKFDRPLFEHLTYWQALPALEKHFGRERAKSLIVALALRALGVRGRPKKGEPAPLTIVAYFLLKFDIWHNLRTFEKRKPLPVAVFLRRLRKRAESCRPAEIAKATEILS